MKTSIFAIATALACCASAQATTVDFETVATVQSTNVNSNGYNFVMNNGGGLFRTNVGNGCYPECASNSTITLLAAGSMFGLADQVVMTQVGGGAFMLSAFDGGEVFSGGYPQYSASSINYEGKLNGNVVSSGSFQVDYIIDGAGGQPDFQTFNLAGVATDSIRFFGTGGQIGNGFSLDNLMVQAAVVPEPGSFALLGLGAFAFAASRRRKAAAK